MKKRYNFTLEEKLIGQVDAIVKSSTDAGHKVSKSEIVEIALFQFIKELVAHASKEVKEKEKK